MTDLLDLFNVLTLITNLEPERAALLQQVMGGPRITAEDLATSGVLPVPGMARKLPAQESATKTQQLDLTTG